MRAGLWDGRGLGTQILLEGALWGPGEREGARNCQELAGFAPGLWIIPPPWERLLPCRLGTRLLLLEPPALPMPQLPRLVVGRGSPQS